jgi:hypothetical protein
MKLPLLKLPAMKLSAILERAGAVSLLAVSLLLLTSALKLHGANMGGTNATAYCADACTNNLLQIGLAVEQYVQDSDEMLPVVHSQADFQTALRPYLASPAVLTCPDTGQPFVFNLALSGHGVYEYADRGTVEVARQDPPPANEPAAILYLDNHVERGGVEVGDPGRIVVSRAKALALGVLQYTQDYDEMYPPMQTQAQFQAAVQPYVGATRDFVTPSGAAFVPNSALSGQSVASVNSPYTTVLLSEPPPYTGGLDTVAYADGHVTRGGIVPGSVSDDVTSRAKQLGLAMIQYVQDYDETYPPMDTTQQFQQALEPYVKGAPVFNTPTGSPFVPNPALSGVSLVSIDSPATTVLFQDVPPYVDGNPTTCYADGHVVHSAPAGADPVIPSLAAPQLLWDNTNGQIALWTLGSVSSFTQNDYGPFPGWTAQATASGPDAVPRLLWTNTSGQISTWAVSADGSYTHDEYGPYPGWTASRLAVGPDNAAHLLWTDTQGQLSLWTVAADGTFTYQNYGPYPQWTAQALSVDPSNQVHVLWTRTDGTISLWDVDASGIPTFQNFGPYPGWTAAALASGPDGYSHIFWNRTDGTLSLWETGTDGTYGHQEYGPYPGWTASGLTVGADNKVHVLWNNTDGTASLWSVDGLGSFTFADYGPYPGWTAQSFSAGR